MIIGRGILQKEAEFERISNHKNDDFGRSRLGAAVCRCRLSLLFAAAKALDTAFAFHASIAAAASLATAFVIFNRYFDRPAALPAQEINGRPNNNMGPINYASVMAMVWGIAGFAV